jgi:hypothetical protein
MTKFLPAQPPSIILPRTAKSYFSPLFYLFKAELPNSQEIPYYNACVGNSKFYSFILTRPGNKTSEIRGNNFHPKNINCLLFNSVL